MFEFIGAIALTWWFIVGVGILLLWSIHYEKDSGSLFFILLLGLATYFFFNISIQTFLLSLIAYIPIGMAWSIFRWKKHCKKSFQKIQEGRSKAAVKNDLTAGKNISKIMSWVIVWPFSFIDSIVGDIYDSIETFVKTKVIKIYNGISGKYLDQL